MNRPQPRKSALSNLNPIQPTNPPAQKKEPKKPSTQQRITIQIDTETLNHARGAYTLDLSKGEATSWSAWVEEALKQATKATSKRHGQQIQPIATGILPRGVPAGTTRQPNK